MQNEIYVRSSNVTYYFCIRGQPFIEMKWIYIYEGVSRVKWCSKMHLEDASKLRR